ncbi:MAG: hypothetical protein ACPGFA_12135 [Pikeienuella sp.]
MAAGRPTKYSEAFVQQGRKLALLGATDEEIADFFEVNVATIYRWKNSHEEFCEALKVGKDAADDRVERSLYQRAVGYSHPEDKVFNDGGTAMVVPTTKHYPPETAAGIFWLKNRRRDSWRDKIDHDHAGGLTINLSPEATKL